MVRMLALLLCVTALCLLSSAVGTPFGVGAGVGGWGRGSRGPMMRTHVPPYKSGWRGFCGTSRP